MDAENSSYQYVVVTESIRLKKGWWIKDIHLQARGKEIKVLRRQAMGKMMPHCIHI
jgi:hypothetical protein